MFLCSEYFAASARQQPHRGEHQPCAEAHAGDIQRRCSVPAEAGGDALKDNYRVIGRACKEHVDLSV